MSNGRVTLTRERNKMSRFAMVIGLQRLRQPRRAVHSRLQLSPDNIQESPLSVGEVWPGIANI